jgi:hypothetical protein
MGEWECNMVTILEDNSKNKHFADAILQGMERGGAVADQMLMERQKAENEFKMFQKYFGNKGMSADKSAPSVGQQLQSGRMPSEMESANEPNEVEEAWLDYKYPKVMEGRREREKMKSKAELAAEPKLLEMEQKLESQEQSGMRFDRLQNLFSPELESQFPPSTLAAAFTKDGELRPIAQSLLSPDAQESVKLVTDEIKGAKDTFGSRVTNFDASTYLKTLPNLLNTAEGRRRVLRDLRIINKLNRMHGEGVLEIIDKYGGPSKISISKAERMYKKQNAKKIEEIRKEFINPDKTDFSEMPDASFYKDRELVDEETGQSFISNGKEWIPT